MRFLKHGLLSIIRKPTKAIMIFVIMFVVFSMVFTGIIINNSVTQSKEFIRRGLGAIVEYKTNYAVALTGVEEVSEDEMTLSMTTVEAISKDSRIDKTYISQSTEIMSNKYKSSTDGQIMVDMDNGGSYFSLKATSDGDDIDFENKTSKIIDGKNISQVDLSTVNNPIVVSVAFAKKNELLVGEEVEFSTFMSQELIKFTIVGIYETDSKQMFDVIYTADSTFDNFPDSQYGPLMTQKTVYFKLKDPLEVDSFIKDNSEKLPSKYTVLDAGNSEYEKLTRPLNLMSVISKIFIGIVFIAGTVIVIALVAIFVRDRKFEVGLLLSSGESKNKIIAQFIFEIAIVAIIAFLLALLLSTQTANYVSEWIIENQLVETTDASMDFMFFEQSQVGEVTMDSVAQDFSVDIDSSLILKLFLISSSILIVASSIPLGIILSYNPRRALQD